ncbi:MAG: GDSL-type esterase/lipase family protein [Lachnospiraceae bacterium]|nr:GDSL-type esterase/lipase family protein [Lachnospiraceae bacterium]
MKSKINRLISVVTAVSLMTGMCYTGSISEAAKKPKLSKSKQSISVGKTKKITVKNSAKKAKVTWKMKGDKAVIVKKSVKPRKAYATVKGVKPGKSTLIASYKAGKTKKKLKCSITVRSAANVQVSASPVKNDSNNINQTTNPITTTNPTAVPTDSATAKPGDNQDAEATKTPEATAEVSVAPDITKEPTKAPEATKEPTKAPEATKEPTKAPAVEPSFVPGSTSKLLDISKFTGSGSYNSARKQYIINDKDSSAASIAFITLPENAKSGEKIQITIKGDYTGDTGFRIWLGNGHSSFSDAVKVFDVDTKTGPFEESFFITATDECNMLTVKCIADWAGGKNYIAGLAIDSIIISYPDREVKPTAAPATKAPENVPTAAPATKEPTPAPVAHALDLSGASHIYMNDAGTITVNSDGTVSGSNIQGMLIPLDDTDLEVGDIVEITVHGNASDSIRGWISTDADNRASEITNPLNFGQTYSFEITGSANYIQLKKKSYNASDLSSINITKIEVKYLKNRVEKDPLPDGKKWVTTWGTAEEPVENQDGVKNFIPLAKTTVRQIIKVTTSGDKFKLRLSNQYGKSPVQVESMHIAKQGARADRSDIITSTDTVVTVNGKASFEIPAGKVIETDTIDFKVTALENVAISTYFGGNVPTTGVTGHRGARATAYQTPGNEVSTESLGSVNGLKTCTGWFFLADASVVMDDDARAVVCFGDSITDGYGTDAGYLGKKPDSYTRWGDYFAKRLQANESTKNVSVINEGIGGNAIFGGLGPAGKDRFRRDLLEHDGVAYCIILFGVNDLDKLQNTSKFNQLKPEYEKMIALCHANNIKVYAAPILPFGTSSYYSEGSEGVRQLINNWFRSSESGVDGIIDFESAVADPDNPKNVREEYTHSDGLHPYDGYEAMANAIDLEMFEK